MDSYLKYIYFNISIKCIDIFYITESEENCQIFCPNRFTMNSFFWVIQFRRRSFVCLFKTCAKSVASVSFGIDFSLLSIDRRNLIMFVLLVYT